MNIRVEAETTSLELNFNDEHWVLSEAGREIVSQTAFEALGPALTALVAIFHAGASSHQKMAVAALFLAMELNEEMTRLLGYLERIDLGTDTAEEIIHEMLENVSKRKSTSHSSFDAFSDEIDGLDLDL